MGSDWPTTKYSLYEEKDNMKENALLRGFHLNITCQQTTEEAGLGVLLQRDAGSISGPWNERFHRCLNGGSATTAETAWLVRGFLCLAIQWLFQRRRAWHDAKIAIGHCVLYLLGALCDIQGMYRYRQALFAYCLPGKGGTPKQTCNLRLGTDLK